MAYPAASAADITSFDAHGYLVVAEAVDADDLEELIDRCDHIIANKEKMAQDWAWEKGKSRDEREFKLLQSSPTLLWPDFIKNAPFRLWAVEFGSALMGREMEFWYDQFLAKPPQKGVATYWHQDEAYWGRNLDDKGITCWMPYHDVDEHNGCMHFIDGGHRHGVLEHRQPEHIMSDMLFCEPDETKAVACPIGKGSVTFHHSKTPHMTTPNQTDQWRRALTQHLQAPGSGWEGDHYPWKVYVNQVTGERTYPRAR